MTYVVAAGDLVLYRTPSESAAFSWRAWWNNSDPVPLADVYRDGPDGLVLVDRVGMLRALPGAPGGRGRCVMMSDRLGYVVIEWNQASHQPGLNFTVDLHDRLDEAEIEAEYLRTETARIGRGEWYSIAEVIELDAQDPS